MWIIENNRLTNTKFTANFAEKSVIPPLPKLLWRVENSRLTHNFFPEEIPEKSTENPYPKALWRVESSRLTHELLPEIYMGAFENAVNLQKIIVPESVVKIGGKSFAGTKLKAVKIAKNCGYSATSFPEDCVINFY